MLSNFLRCAPVALTVVVLIGWWFDVDELKGFGMPAMSTNPTTACCLILLCTASLLLKPRRKIAGTRDYVMLTLLALIIGCGILKLLDLVPGIHIGIDEMLFARQLPIPNRLPSRMAPNSAACFILLSLAILCLTSVSERLVVTAQLLALVTGLTSLFAIIGYIFGVTSLYQVHASVPMSPHVAVSFLSLSTFILMETRRSALMVPISDDGAGGRTARRLLPVAFVLPVVAGWFTLNGEREGLYTTTIDVTIMVIVNLLVFTILIWWNARLLLRAELRRRETELELARAATHDFLTGLANRGLFMDRLVTRLAAFRRRETELFAVIYMDLDGFKQINDRLGHEAGDTLLRDVAALLGSCIRSDDLVARIGGDEFTMLLDRISGPEDLSLVATRILAGMPRSYGPPENRVPTGISIGGVISDPRHFYAESVLNDADLALYQSKRRGKQCFTLYVA